MSQANIMIIDNEAGLCRLMEDVLGDVGYSVRTYTDPQVALDEFRPGVWDLVISDVKMPKIDGLELLKRLHELDAELPVIMITAFATVEMSIQALRQGALDMLTKPFEPDELTFRVANALSHNRLLEENRELKEELAERCDCSDIIGRSAGLQMVFERLARVAGRDISVLITGESGTGKELIAQAIHKNSPRRERRFVAINCGALPATVLESELFGYRKGAFTGASEDRKGLLEAADGGTLFLDEVGNLPDNVQKTLLRFLQEKEFIRLGDSRPIRVDLRLVSATNTDLEAAVQAGHFREDLYYRLNVVNLVLPPLRERREDIPLLVAAFVEEFNQRFDSRMRGLAPEAMEALVGYAWPGNVRQLRNVIEAAMAIEAGAKIQLDTLQQLIDVGSTEAGQGGEGGYAGALARFEIDYLRRLLRDCNGNIEEAAEAAGMNMATVYRKMKKYRLKKREILQKCKS